MICFIICVFPFRSFPSSPQVFSVIKKAHEGGRRVTLPFTICNPYTLAYSSIGRAFGC